MIEIEFCIGKKVCLAPISAVPFLHAGERYKTREYKKAICDLATILSYRKAWAEFNKRYNRTVDSALTFSTYVHDVILCGTKLISDKREVTRARLIFYGFCPDTCEYVHGELPCELRNHMPEWVIVSPKTGVVLFPSDEWDPDNPGKEIPDEYLYVHPATGKVCSAGTPQSASGGLDAWSGGEDNDRDEKGNAKPDDDPTKYPNKRRGTNTEVPPEKKAETIDAYVVNRNGFVRSYMARILYRFGVEYDSREVVYICSDADLVPKQCKTHVKGGKPERKRKSDPTDEPLNVVHWDIKVVWDDHSYGITGTREDVYRQLLVFLLENHLINRFMIFFTDGETCIFEDIGRYFKYWNYAIYLDYYHMEHKASELLSLAIQHVKVNDPRETPEYYKRGSKKGQVKKWPSAWLSILFHRKLSAALFAGNWKEAILYLRDISPAHVKDSNALNDLIKYIWRKRHYITCTALRKKVGLHNSSNPSESLNNEYVSDLQKGKGKNWREPGSYAVAALTACFKNSEADKWFYEDVFTFKKDWATLQ